MAVKIIVDSAADYSAKELERRGFICVPMTVTFGGEQYRDGEDLTKEEFFEKLMTEKEFPTTSQPSPGEFAACFEEAKKAGDSVVAVLLSGALSGTLQSAVIAKEMVEYEEIYLVDSKTASLGIRILADQAAVMASQGKTAPEIVKELEELKGRIRIYAGLDTLDYLCKGGRLSRAEAGIGKLANIKPLVTVNQAGTVAMCGKQMGIRHACRQAAKLVEMDQPDQNYPVYYLYAYDRKNCLGFIQTLKKMGMDFGEPKLRGIGPTIGTHIGPGAFGIVYVGKEIHQEGEK